MKPFFLMLGTVLLAAIRFLGSQQAPGTRFCTVCHGKGQRVRNVTGAMRRILRLPAVTAHVRTAAGRGVGLRGGPGPYSWH